MLFGGDIMAEANFPLAQLCLPCQVQFQHLSMATLKTFMLGDFSGSTPQVT